MQLPSIRITNLLAFLLCGILLATGIFLELVLKLEPCPLCILQRLTFIVLGILFLIGCLLPLQPKGRCYFQLFIAAVALFGVCTAGRQVWIEHLPLYALPSCGASLKYLFQILSPFRALQIVFQGTGSCAEVKWRFLGLSLPMWSLLAFVFFMGLSIWQAYRKVVSYSR